MLKELRLKINPAYDPSKDTSNRQSFCFRTHSHWKSEHVHLMFITKTSQQHHPTSPKRHWHRAETSPTQSQGINHISPRHHRDKTKTPQVYCYWGTSTHPQKKKKTQTRHCGILATKKQKHQPQTLGRKKSTLQHFLKKREGSWFFHVHAGMLFFEGSDLPCKSRKIRISWE